VPDGDSSLITTNLETVESGQYDNAPLLRGDGPVYHEESPFAGGQSALRNVSGDRLPNHHRGKRDKSVSRVARNVMLWIDIAVIEWHDDNTSYIFLANTNLIY
jgi:hypothetical protein